MPCRLHGVPWPPESRRERAHAERRMRIGVAGGKFADAVARLAIRHRRLATGRAPHHIRHSRRASGLAVATSARGRRSACRPYPLLDLKACLLAAGPHTRPRNGIRAMTARGNPTSSCDRATAPALFIQPIERGLLRCIPFACPAMASDLVADQGGGRAMEAAAAGDHLVIGNGDDLDAMEGQPVHRMVAKRLRASSPGPVRSRAS